MAQMVTVIGGTGFLGRYVVRELARAGYGVKILSRHPSRGTFLNVSAEIGQIAHDYADLAKPDSLKGKLDGSYAVINLVGILFEKGRQRFEAMHHLGAKAIAEEAKKAGVARLIHLSSLGVDKATQSSYASSKLKGEEAVKAAFSGVTILRPSLVIGAEDGFFNRFAKMAQFSPFLPAIGGGNTQFQPVYVGDVARAVLACLQREESKGLIYELGGPRAYSFKGLLSYMQHVTQQSRPFIPLPFALAGVAGFFAQLLPNPPLTADQVQLLKTDNVCSGDHPGLFDLGLTPTAIEQVVPTYLARYRGEAA